MKYTFQTHTDKLEGVTCVPELRFLSLPPATNLSRHTHILSWGTLLCCTRCIDLLFPLTGSLSLGDFNNLELDDEDAPVPPPLDERLLPPPLPPLLFEDRDEKREYIGEEVGVKGGLLEELCRLSGRWEKERVHQRLLRTWRHFPSNLKFFVLHCKCCSNSSLTGDLTNQCAFLFAEVCSSLPINSARPPTPLLFPFPFNGNKLNLCALERKCWHWTVSKQGGIMSLDVPGSTKNSLGGFWQAGLSPDPQSTTPLSIMGIILLCFKVSTTKIIYVKQWDVFVGHLNQVWSCLLFCTLDTTDTFTSQILWKPLG